MIKKLDTFKQKVFQVVRGISSGTTLTYKEVAELAGRPFAWRAVGNILNTNYDSAIPCHRVVRSNGTVGGYNRGGTLKKKLLAEEEKS
ncbi:MAG: 6-O-methylguanine DNA methyltransferase [Candidatus Ryanbacteria bacterium RIFCSPHIGHO2_02_FULL_45_13b]|uniref:6-O-methylguanine DNA methyltransferase n=1 Tax=Candidatus Ryanbacteria bacterium RIFCSPHIGHO2_02_FULL_45_13b TaxID=1802117 RepID=A0A1G2GAL9_9BACT|nr:MAG: 6-O-methylguanine DNA methyltransferase [Candidatus Ryanbacteria bacterium RIFCSPHIGHO2_02_FULL_45_13b]